MFDTWGKEPAKRALVILTGPGHPREVQHTDDAGRFRFEHAAGRTHLGVYFSNRPEEHLTWSCGEIRIELKDPKNVIEI